ncbi:MAG: glycerol-3-phosphate acyltransferase [Tissierellales bacterium]|nr:glycerol-3-phosphate acyltransferase [Tissierellales bacterium]
MTYIISALIGYLTGCFQTAYLLGRYLKKTDIRKLGTNNAGASNATIVFGWKYGIITALIDMGKTIIAVNIVAALYPDLQHLKFIAGIFCILGHIFPFYLHFKGGKGFASYVGLALAINWKIGLTMIILSFLVTVVTDYIVVSTLLSTALYPVYLYLEGEDFIVIGMMILLFFLIAFKHKENIKKILAGEERGLSTILKRSKKKVS